MYDIERRVRVLDRSVDADIKRLQGLKDSLKIYYNQASYSYYSGTVSYGKALTRLEGTSLEGIRYDRYLSSLRNWMTVANTRKTELSEGIGMLKDIMDEIDTRISELEPKRYYYEWRVM